MRHEELGTVAFDNAYAAGAERLVPMPGFVIQIYPAAAGLHAGNLMRAGEKPQRNGQYAQNFTHNAAKIA